MNLIYILYIVKIFRIEVLSEKLVKIEKVLLGSERGAKCIRSIYIAKVIT